MPQDKKIISFQNPRIKNIGNLRERKTRDETGLMIVEGFREISRANEAGVSFKELYICRDLLHHQGAGGLIAEIQAKKTEILEIPKEIFAKISFGERQEGLLAVCKKPKCTFADLKLQKNPLIVVVEKVEKPGNLGAILRSCDGAGVDALFLCDGRVDSSNPNVVRASLGTVFSMKVIECSNEEAFQYLHDNQIKICTTLLSAKMIYTDMDFKIPVAIILGSEEEGLSDFWVKNSDFQVKIPMHGKADSLNVSTTAAVLIYEGLRQRNIN